MKKYLPFILGALAGAVAGYLYYAHVGCNGECMIGSSPVISTLYGSVMGILAINLFHNPRVKKEVN